MKALINFLVSIGIVFRGRTRKYQGKKYLINNKNSHRLKIGDIVIVHPTEKSISTKPFEAVIINKTLRWTTGIKKEVCTHVTGNHSAVMNDYLFNRLEYKEC